MEMSLWNILNPFLKRRQFPKLLRFIVAARQGAGLSQNAVEEASGIRQPVIARMETAATNPQLDTILRAADISEKVIIAQRREGGMFLNEFPHVGAEHNPPHAHCEYGEFAAAIDIRTLQILDGFLPTKKYQLVCCQSTRPDLIRQERPTSR